MTTPYSPGSKPLIASGDLSSEINLSSSDLSRVLPRQLSTGNQRGVMNITGSITIADSVTGKKTIAIDGTNNVISVNNDTGSQIGMGLVPGSTDFGFYAVDSSGFLLYKIVGSTQYWYDKTYNVNNIQEGLLPDGSYGLAIAKPGNSVASAFS